MVVVTYLRDIIQSCHSYLLCYPSLAQKIGEVQAIDKVELAKFVGYEVKELKP